MNREIVNFMKEENERTRQHDIKLMEMQMNFLKQSYPALPKKHLSIKHMHTSLHTQKHNMYQSQIHRQADIGEPEEMYSTIGSAFKNYSEL